MQLLFYRQLYACRGSRNTPSRFVLPNSEIRAGLISHLARMYTERPNCWRTLIVERSKPKEISKNWSIISYANESKYFHNYRLLYYNSKWLELRSISNSYSLIVWVRVLQRTSSIHLTLKDFRLSSRNGSHQQQQFFPDLPSAGDNAIRTSCCTL